MEIEIGQRNVQRGKVVRRAYFHEETADGFGQDADVSVWVTAGDSVAAMDALVREETIAFLERALAGLRVGQ